KFIRHRTTDISHFTTADHSSFFSQPHRACLHFLVDSEVVPTPLLKPAIPLRRVRSGRYPNSRAPAKPAHSERNPHQEAVRLRIFRSRSRRGIQSQQFNGLRVEAKEQPIVRTGTLPANLSIRFQALDSHEGAAVARCKSPDQRHGVAHRSHG